MTRSAITGLLTDYGSAIGIEALGSLTLTNSTVAGIDSNSAGGALVLGESATATINNSTIAGNRGNDPAFAGLVTADGAQVRLENSLVVGNAIVDNTYRAPTTVSDVDGTIASNGHNLFGQQAVEGAIAGDVNLNAALTRRILRNRPQRNALGD